MKRSNALTKEIISTIQKAFDIQTRNIENLAMDIHVRQQLWQPAICSGAE